jgi:hypothetical protein
MSGHDRVGAGSMVVRGYVQEKQATQSEGTFARVRNYLISAVVTKPGGPWSNCTKRDVAVTSTD